MVGKLVEIRIRKVSELSEQAQKEVVRKLSVIERPFNFRGYAKVTYTEASPYSIAGVDPIEGTINDFFIEIRKQVGMER